MSRVRIARLDEIHARTRKPLKPILHFLDVTYERYVRTLRLVEQISPEQSARNRRLTFRTSVVAGRTFVPARALHIKLTPNDVSGPLWRVAHPSGRES